MKSTPKPFLIFTFDGGGVRGILPAALLEKIACSRPAVLRLVDLFAGTSTGSIIAASLALGMHPHQISAAYEKLAPVVFRLGFLKSIPVIGNALVARYTNRTLRHELNRVFGRVKLGDVPKKLLIPAFDLDSPAANLRPRAWKPKFFNNFQQDDLDFSLVDVILSSTAAPTYFPVWQHYIDGGVAANNPSMAALAQAIDMHTGRQPLSNIVLLSLGTGFTPSYISGQHMSWGWLPWASRLVNLMLDGTVSVADYQVQRLLDKRYFRLNPVLKYSAPIDSTAAIPALKSTAQNEDLTGLYTWLDTNLDKFYQPSRYIPRGQH